MNIIEAYIKFNGQLLIFLSGLSGCGKTSVAKSIKKGLNLEMIDQVNYYKKDYNTTITLPDGNEVLNLSTDDAFDWDKLNADIEKYKSKGLLVSGFALPEDKITSKVDYHVHLSISKKECIERRHQYLEKHKDEFPEEYAMIDSPAEKLKLNQLVYPYYLDVTKRSKINKFININTIPEDETVIDLVFDNIIEFIQEFIIWFNENKYPEWKAKNVVITETKNNKNKKEKESPKKIKIEEPSSDTDTSISSSDSDEKDFYDEQYHGEDGPIVPIDSLAEEEYYDYN